uniref:Wilms tumor protein homolog n=1 Tax=Culex pipiens TaxID=7175 RepID=A0A8D8N1J9_CULPI
MEVVGQHGGTTAFLDMDFCRLCLGRDKTGLISVYSAEVNPAGAGDESLVAKILRFFEVRICEEDILPRQICQQCLLQTESCAEFRDVCIRNDQKLREIICFPEPAAPEVGEGEGEQQQAVELKAEQVPLAGEEDEDEEEEEEREEVVIDPANNYESSNQSAPEPYSEGEDGDDTALAESSDLNDGGLGLVLDANTNDSSEDLLEVMGEDLADKQLKKLVHMCRYCDVAFALPNACYLHETQDHDILAPYGCQFCEFKTANRNMLITHIRDLHGIDRPYICIQCNKGFHRRSDLKKHTFVHSGVRPFSCDECGKSFSRNTNLTKHLRIHSGFKPHKCKFNNCSRSFANKADLVRHQNIHMSLGKQFSCAKCNNTYARKDKLLSHERICFAKQHQQQQQQLIQILAPTTTTTSSAHFDAGENMVISLDPYRTEIDPASAAGPTEDDPGIPNAAPVSAISSFSNVIREELSTVQPKLFSCAKCPKKFLSKNTLHTHQLTHSDVRNYRCHTCDKKFIRKRELDRHLTAVHSNHKPYECKQCSKRFSRKDKLLRHERVHREDRLFACGACDAKFLRKEALAVHSKVHCTAAAEAGVHDPAVIIMIGQGREGDVDDADDEERHELLQQVLSYEVGGIEAAAML